jgi:hypothetical protein
MARNQQNIEINHLTTREREVFIGVARGLTSTQIAQQRGISRRVVDHCRTLIRRKLRTCAGIHRHPWYEIAEREGWLNEPEQAPTGRRQVTPRRRRRFDSTGEPIDPLVERICAKWRPYALDL